MVERERESYENEVLKGGAKMEKGKRWRGLQQWWWQLVLGGDGDVDQRQRWRRGVESDRERGFV